MPTNSLSTFDFEHLHLFAPLDFELDQSRLQCVIHAERAEIHYPPHYQLGNTIISITNWVSLAIFANVHTVLGPGGCFRRAEVISRAGPVQLPDKWECYSDYQVLGFSVKGARLSFVLDGNANVPNVRLEFDNANWQAEYSTISKA